MLQFKVNNATHRYDQLRMDYKRLDLPQWLQSHQIYPKVYWQDKVTRTEHATLGRILCLDEIPHFEEAPQETIRFYGGMRFPSHKQGMLWEAFPQCCFWLPSIEVIQTLNSTELILHSLNEKVSDALLGNLDPGYSAEVQKLSSILQKKESISLNQWKENIAHILDTMQKENIQKVVIARKKELHFSCPLQAWNMISAWKNRVQNSTLFAFQLSANTAFIGASPEKLFYRNRDTLYIDAVAGTRPRGISEKEDVRWERELSTHPKEKREFNSVKAFIDEAMRPLAKQCSWLKQDEIVKTAHVQHFYNQASIFLKKKMRDVELITALHPTPAVGGVPRNKALELIDQYESFERGWYAAPVGWISQSETNLIVAIRSGLAIDSTLHLFAGAGIVAESCIEKEWEEIEHKMKVLLYGCGLAE